MATTQTSLPSYREPPFDANGNWSRSWWRFFESISKTIGGGNVPDLSTIIAAITELRGQIQEQAITPSDITAQLALARLQGLEEWVMGLSKGPDLSQYVLFETLQNVLSAYAPLSALAAYAPLASPALTGTPTAPTAVAGTNTTQLATTAFVQAALAKSFFTNQASVALTSGTPANITSLSLSAGDWDVGGNIEYTPSATGVLGVAVTGVNDVSATGAPIPFRTIGTYTAAASSLQSQIAPTRRYLLAVPTTIYLVGFCTFTGAGATLTANGFIRAQPR